MRSPLGFIIPGGCRRPRACRPDNPVYVRFRLDRLRPRTVSPVLPGEEAQADGSQWECPVCNAVVKPQSAPDYPVTLSPAERGYLLALARRCRPLDCHPPLDGVPTSYI